jgi:hypothetical protein
MKKEFQTIALSHSRDSGYDTEKVTNLLNSGWQIDHIVTPAISFSAGSVYGTAYGQIIYHMSREIKTPTPTQLGGEI